MSKEMNKIIEMTKSSYSACQRTSAIIAGCTEKAETIFTKLKTTQEYYDKLTHFHKKALKETRVLCENKNNSEEVIKNIDQQLRGVMEQVLQSTKDSQCVMKTLDLMLSQILNNVNVDFTKLNQFPEVNDE